MPLPSVSVVIPTWNEQPQLGKTLTQINEQTVRPLEVIVVDKYSRDGTGKLAENLGAKVIYSHESVASARNRGAEACHGDIVAFTEADVIPSKLWIEAIINRFVESPKLLAAAGPGYPFYAGQVSRGLDAEYLVYNRFRVLVGRLGLFMCSGYNLAVRRRVLDRVHFPDVVPNDDGLFGYAVSRLGSTLFCPELAVRISSRRFERFGLAAGNMYYTFMVENLFPFLRPLFDARRRISSARFEELRL